MHANHTAIADRRAATLIGVLFIVGTVAFVLSAVVTAGAFASGDPRAVLDADPGVLGAGVLLVLVAGLALAMVPVVFWPIGRRYDETLAMGYVVLRGGLESMTYLVLAICWLVLIALGSQPDSASASTVVLEIAAAAGRVLAIPFALGALLFLLILHRARLVPRWLSGWGLVGAALYLAVPVLGVLGVGLDALMGPLALQEMVLAAWLIAKGFAPAEAAPAERAASSIAIPPAVVGA